MFRALLRIGKNTQNITPVLGIGLFRSSRNSNDIDYINAKLQDDPKTGMDRLKKMFDRDLSGDISLELNNVLQASMSGAIIGACIGGFVKSRVAYINFIENNQATIFKSTQEAQKLLQERVTLAFANGAYTWGWRLCIFTGMFTLIATMVSVYRDETSLIQFIAAGALTGGLYKVNLGLAATFVGAGLGAALSLVSGVLILSLLKVTGFSMHDIRKALHRFKESRQQQFDEMLEKASEVNDDLTRHHDQVVKEKLLGTSD